MDNQNLRRGVLLLIATLILLALALLPSAPQSLPPEPIHFVSAFTLIPRSVEYTYDGVSTTCYVWGQYKRLDAINGTLVKQGDCFGWLVR